MEILNILEAGGFVMYPLLLCSIVVWAVALEKIWFFNKIRRQFISISVRANELLGENKHEEAKGLAHGVHRIIASPYLGLMEGRHLDKELLGKRISRKLIEARIGFKRYLWPLGTIGAAAPFIGLFGTVIGIIKSFASIARTGKSGFSVVAAGLSEALIATAAGILVAVMAVIFYNYLQNQSGVIFMEFKNRIEDLFDLVIKSDDGADKDRG